MKPILFNTEMTRAILKDRKTETRRLVKPTPREAARLVMSEDKRSAMDVTLEICDCGPDDRRIYIPRYYPGDILYVRETWRRACASEAYYGFGRIVSSEELFGYRYQADNGIAWDEREPRNNEFYLSTITEEAKWHPSIHMPKEAARIFLRVTDVRVEHLLDIEEDGARAEGIGEYFIGMGESGFATGAHSSHFWETAVGAFADLWSRTVKPADLERCGWEADPWVWVIKFERITKEEAYGH